MSKEKIEVCEDLADIMPPEYQELVATATYGKEDRGWKDIGTSKELIEQHSLCAGCPESIAFRYILASLPAPEIRFLLVPRVVPVWYFRMLPCITSILCSATRMQLHRVCNVHWQSASRIYKRMW